MEALSAADDTNQITRLMHDDQSIETVQAIVFLGQDSLFAQGFAREGTGWRAFDARGLEAEIATAAAAAPVIQAKSRSGHRT